MAFLFHLALRSRNKSCDLPPSIKSFSPELRNHLQDGEKPTRAQNVTGKKKASCSRSKYQGEAMKNQEMGGLNSHGVHRNR